MAATADLAEIGRDDLEEIVRFQSSEAAAGTTSTAAPDARKLHWFLFENPETRPDLPKGWVARDAQRRVVGVKLCSPERFRCGDQQYVLLMGGGYYVSREHRGLGLRLMREYLALGDRYSHFASTMNEISGALYERYGGYPIADTEHEMLGILRWTPLLEEVLVRRIGRPALARLLAVAGALRPAAVSAAEAGALREVTFPTDLDTLGIETPAEHARQITAARRADFLRWRYQAGPDRTRALFVYDDGTSSRVLVGTRLEPRGYRRHVRALTVLDYWGSAAPDTIARVASALARRFRDDADLIVFRGQPATRRACLEAAGFVWRALPRAIGVCIDRAQRLPTREWYMVPADGDMAT